MTHSAVRDVAVVGLNHEVDGEHPLAYVVIKTDEEGRPLASPKELIDFTNGLKMEKTISCLRSELQRLNLIRVKIELIRESRRFRTTERRCPLHRANSTQ
jgi:acyl-CoA synthetase (AMP-forming)/AMP-acid ligase II